MRKKILSLLLAGAMVFTMPPTLVFADGVEDVQDSSITAGTSDNESAENAKPLDSGAAEDIDQIKNKNTESQESDGSDMTVIQKADSTVKNVRKSDSGTIYDSMEIDSIALIHDDDDTRGTVALDVNQVLTVGEHEYNWIFTPEDASSYNTKTGKISLTVVRDEPTGIMVTASSGAKTNYVYGDKFERTNMQIRLRYVSGQQEDVTERAEIKPDVLTTDCKNVEISCDGRSTKWSINVEPKKVDDPKIQFVREKNEYTGSELKPTVIVKDGNMVIPDTEYNVRYSNNIDVGVGSVHIMDREGGNYIVNDTKGFIISPKRVTITGLTATKQYDGKNTATLTGGTLQGIVKKDASEVKLSTTGVNATYDSANAGQNRAIVITGKYTLTGERAKNYNLEQPCGITGSITPKPLTLASATAVSREYIEGDKTVSIDDVKFAESGPFPITSGYTVTGTMDNADAGNKKTVHAVVTLTDKNYSLAKNTIDTMVNIDKATVNGKTEQCDDKFGTTVRLSLGDMLVSGAKVIQDGISLNGKKDIFVSKPTVQNGVLTYQIVNDENMIDKVAMIQIPVEESDNYKDYIINVAVKVRDKPSWTINTAGAVTCEFGDSNKAISATVNDNGNITYGILTNEDVISVDPYTGVLTIRKVGNAQVQIVAQATNEYASTMKIVDVTVKPKRITAPTANTATFTYNGKMQTYMNAAKDYTVENGMKVDANEDGYPVTVKLVDKDNTCWSTGGNNDMTFNFVIQKASLSVKADDKTILIDDPVPPYTVTTKGLVDGDTIKDVNFDDGGASSKTKGSFSIIPKGGVISSGNDNYSIRYQKGTLTVNSTDVSSIDTALAAANTAKVGVVADDRATNQVVSGTKFVTTAEMTSLNDAIVVATDAKDTVTSIEEAKKAAAVLNTAVEAFKVAIKTGIYVAPSSGSGSGSSGSSSGSTSSGNNQPNTKSVTPVVTPVITIVKPQENPTKSYVGKSTTETEIAQKPANDTNIKPTLMNDKNIKGWNRIKDKIQMEFDKALVGGVAGLSEGENPTEPIVVTIDVGDATTLPKDVIALLQGKNIDLTLSMGDGIQWTINGLSITGKQLSDIDLSVTKNVKKIPVDIINQVTGENDNIQIELSHNGDFGFEAVLTIDLSKDNAGLYANLFYYNEEVGKLEFINSALIDKDGNAAHAFTHASAYTIVISEEKMDETALDTDNLDKAGNGEQETDDTTAITQKTIETSGNMLALWIALGVVIATLIGGAVIYFKKKRD